METSRNVEDDTNQLDSFQSSECYLMIAIAIFATAAYIVSIVTTLYYQNAVDLNERYHNVTNVTNALDVIGAFEMDSAIAFKILAIAFGCCFIVSFLLFLFIFVRSSSSKDNSHKKCCFYCFSFRGDDFASSAYFAYILPTFTAISGFCYIFDSISSRITAVFYPFVLFLFLCLMSFTSLTPLATLVKDIAMIMTSLIFLSVFLALSLSLKSFGSSVSQTFLENYDKGRNDKTRARNDDHDLGFEWTQQNINRQRTEIYERNNDATRVPGPLIKDAIILVFFAERRFWLSKLLSFFVHLGIVVVTSVFLSLYSFSSIIASFEVSGVVLGQVLRVFIIFSCVSSGISVFCLFWWMFLAICPTGYVIYSELFLSKERCGYMNVSTWGFSSNQRIRWYYVLANLKGWSPDA
jgi:hypothetical protein